MNLGSQAITAKSFNKHLVARAHSKKKFRKSMILALSLTSMVDMFSLLVIFLLQTFSTSPEMLVVSKGVTLPTAISGHEIVDAPVLAVSDAEIYLDQKLVGATNEVLKKPEELLSRLEKMRELWLRTHPDQVFKGEINLQAHSGVPSTVISQVMGLLPSQNYSSIQLVVMSGGK